MFGAFHTLLSPGRRTDPLDTKCFDEFFVRQTGKASIRCHGMRNGAESLDMLLNRRQK